MLAVECRFSPGAALPLYVAVLMSPQLFVQVELYGRSWRKNFAASAPRCSAMRDRPASYLAAPT